MLLTFIVRCLVCTVKQHTSSMTFPMLPLALIHDGAVSNAEPAIAMPETIQDLSLICCALPGVHLQRILKVSWVLVLGLPCCCRGTTMNIS